MLIVLKKIDFDDRFAVLVHNFLKISNPLHYSCWRMNLLKSKKVTMEMLTDDMMLMVDLRPEYQSVKNTINHYIDVRYLNIHHH